MGDFDDAAGEREMASKMRESPTRCGRLGRSADIHNNTHTRAVLTLNVGLGLVFVHLFRFSILCVF